MVGDVSHEIMGPFQCDTQNKFQVKQLDMLSMTNTQRSLVTRNAGTYPVLYTETKKTVNEFHGTFEYDKDTHRHVQYDVHAHKGLIM